MAASAPGNKGEWDAANCLMARRTRRMSLSECHAGSGASSGVVRAPYPGCVAKGAGARAWVTVVRAAGCVMGVVGQVPPGCVADVDGRCTSQLQGTCSSMSTMHSREAPCSTQMAQPPFLWPRTFPTCPHREQCARIRLRVAVAAAASGAVAWPPMPRPSTLAAVAAAASHVRSLHQHPRHRHDHHPTRCTQPQPPQRHSPQPTAHSVTRG